MTEKTNNQADIRAFNFEGEKAQRSMITRQIQIELYNHLKLLTPYDIDNYNKIRLGESSDGGYVILDKLDGDILLSFGIGTLAQFEEDAANLGYDVYLFDHTITDLPKSHKKFKFFKEGLSCFDDSDTSTLESYLKRFNLTSNKMMLKIDIEGYEYRVFESVSATSLLQFEQIIVEFHCLTELGNNVHLRHLFKSALEKLTAFFNIIHVHANNYGLVKVINGFTIADSIELTFIRRDIGIIKPSSTFYPTELDRSNNNLCDDIPLSFFPFLPK